MCLFLHELIFENESQQPVLYLADGEWLTANLCLRVISIRNNRLID